MRFEVHEHAWKDVTSWMAGKARWYEQQCEICHLKRRVSESTRGTGTKP